jgi:hypothetical protein
MRTYRLVQKDSNHLKATFHVLNSSDDIVGSINVPPNQVADLLRHWVGTSSKAQQSEKQQSQNPIVAAIFKAKSRIPNQAAILRGCL